MKERTHVRKPRRRQRRWAAPLGLLIVVLSVIGLFTLGKSGVEGVKKLVNNDAKKAAYEEFLSGVVMIDPDPFDDVKKANLDQLVEAAIWSLLKSNTDPYKYEDDEGWMKVPAKDVEAQFQKMFGSDVKLAHKTVSGYGFEFTYDPSTKTYKIPPTGVEVTYIPDVEKIEKKGDAVILTVGYIAGSKLEQDENGNLKPTTPDKYMLITLRAKDGKQYVSAIQAADVEITAATKKGDGKSTAAGTSSSQPATSVPSTAVPSAGTTGA